MWYGTHLWGFFKPRLQLMSAKTLLFGNNFTSGEGPMTIDSMVLTGKKNFQIKLQPLQKVQIWTFGLLAKLHFLF